MANLLMCVMISGCRVELSLLFLVRFPLSLLQAGSGRTQERGGGGVWVVVGFVSSACSLLPALQSSLREMELVITDTFR